MSNMFPLVSFIPYTPSGVFPFHQSCDRRSPSLRPAPASRAATANTANTANTTNTASRSRRRARRRPSSVLGDKRQCRPGNQTWLGSLNGQIQYIHKYSINILIYAVNKYIHNIYIWETNPSNWGIFHCHLYRMSLSQFSLSHPARARRVGHFLVQLLT